MDSYTIMMDSSAISCLYEGGSSEEVVRGFQAAGEFRVSAISVLEAIADGDISRRTALLNLQKQMTRNTRPFDLPEAIIRKSLVAFSKGDMAFSITVDGDHVAAWEVIEDPSTITEDVVEIARQANADEEEKFYRFHRELREDLNRLFGAGVQRPPSANEYMRALLESAAHFHERVAPIYSKLAGEEIQVSQVARLLSGSPSIKTYFLALAYADFKRSMADTHYGRKNAGLKDLSFAAYLPHVSVFVTDDQEQETALRLVGGLVNAECEVLGYGEWSGRILL